MLIPKKHAIAKKMREYYLQLCSMHDIGRLVELHKEGQLYNFHMSPTGPPKMIGVGSLEAQKSSGADGTRPGNGQGQAKP